MEIPKYNKTNTTKNSPELTEEEPNIISDDESSKKTLDEYNQSVFRGFESFLGLKGVDEENTEYVLKSYISGFIEDEIEPGKYEIVQLIEDL